MRGFVLRSFCTTIFSVLLISGFICGCSSDDSDSSGEAQESTSLKTPLEDDEVLLQRASEQAIARFAAEMMAALTHAVHEEGPAEALNVCKVVAPDIAVAHAKEGWFLSRVTDKPRNPNNEADADQEVILSRFQADTTLHFIAQ